MKRKLLLLLTCLLVSTGFAMAQSRVTGKVTSDDGQPVAGASVVVEGTTIGTYADVDGNFALANVPASATNLIVSFIGMQEEKVPIAPYVSVVLFQDENRLAETVVVAYGTQSRQSVTGSVAVVDDKKIQQRVGTSVTGALEGSAPGIQVNNTYGEPGSSPGIRIRGYTIGSGQSPLYVVDGVIFDGSIADLNAADISSLSVLKDAASAALYGNRASNGVILITTKSGSGSSKPAVTVKVDQGVYTRGIPAYDRLGPDEWMQAAWRGMKNYAMTSELGYDAADAAAYATEHIIPDYAKLNIYDGADDALFDANGKLAAQRKGLYDDLNWFDAVEQTGSRQEYNVSGSVASSRFNVYASVGYLKEKGYIVGTQYERFTGRLNTSYTPVKWFKTGINLNATVSDRDYNPNASGSYYANPFYIAQTMAPIYPYYLHAPDGAFVLDADGNKQWDTESTWLSNRNVAYERRVDINRTHRNVLGGQAFATINLPYGFAVTVKGDVSHRNSDRQKYDNPEIGDGANKDGRLTTYAYRYFNYTAQELLTWEHDYGLHHVDVLTGHENYKYESKNFYGMNTGMAIPGIITMTNFQTNSYLYGDNDTETSESYLARARYNYDQKYFFDASFRRDGSSRFHPDNRWGNFFSFGASWNIKKEDFMQQVDWVDDLRLRAAFGEVGNNANVSLYAYQALYYIEKNGGSAALIKQTLAAPDIKWETTRTVDAALEGSLFGNRLDFSVGYFDKRSVDLLFSVPLPLSLGGFNYEDDSPNLSIYKNIGTVSNSGVELSFSGDVIRTRDFSWNLGVDATFLKNRIITLPDHEDVIASGVQRYTEGKSVYEFYTYKYQGVDQLTGRALYTIDPDKKENAEAAGELVTINGTDYATDTSYGLQDWSGSAVPTVYGSVNTGLRWKNFTLNALFTYSLGGKLYDSVYQNLISANSATAASAYHKDILDSWNGVPDGITETSPDRIDPNGIPALDFNRSNKHNATSDRWLISNSYLVVKNINLGYNLPSKWVNKIGMEGIRINASVENLFTLSARKGMNPQYSFSGGADQTYVTARVFNLGVTLNF